MGKKALFVIMVGSVVGGAVGLAGSGCSPADTFNGGDATFDSGNNGDGSNRSCLTAAATFGPAQQSTQMLNACTQTELGTLDTMIRSSSGTTYVALYGMVGASCQKCLFSSSSDGNWQSFVWVPSMQQVIADLDAGGGSGTVFDNTVGACIAHVPAGGTMCAVAATQNDECHQTSCFNCTSQSDFDTCENSSAAATQCGSIDTRATDCMSRDQYNQALTQCGFDLTAKTVDFKAMLNVTCGTGTPASPGDGGTTDGGTTDSGSKDASGD